MGEVFSSETRCPGGGTQIEVFCGRYCSGGGLNREGETQGRLLITPIRPMANIRFGVTIVWMTRESYLLVKHNLVGNIYNCLFSLQPVWVCVVHSVGFYIFMCSTCTCPRPAKNIM